MATPSKKASTENTVVSQASLSQLDAARSNLRRKFMGEERVQVTVAPFYAPYLGRNAMVSIQGIAVYVRADGRPYKINASHAAALSEAMRAVDSKVRKEQAMADVQRNFERSPGELRFV